MQVQVLREIRACLPNVLFSLIIELATSSGDLRYKVALPLLPATEAHEQALAHHAVVNDDEHVYVVSETGVARATDVVHVFNKRGGTLAKTFRTTEQRFPASNVAIDARHLYTVSHDGLTVVVLDKRDGQQVQTLRLSNDLVGLYCTRLAVSRGLLMTCHHEAGLYSAVLQVIRVDGWTLLAATTMATVHHMASDRGNGDLWVWARNGLHRVEAAALPSLWSGDLELWPSHSMSSTNNTFDMDFPYKLHRTDGWPELAVWSGVLESFFGPLGTRYTKEGESKSSCSAITMDGDNVWAVKDGHLLCWCR